MRGQDTRHHGAACQRFTHLLAATVLAIIIMEYFVTCAWLRSQSQQLCLARNFAPVIEARSSDLS